MGGYEYTVVLKGVTLKKKLELIKWTDKLPKDSYYWNMSMNKHQWYLHFHNSEDVLAFKLAYGL